MKNGKKTHWLRMTLIVLAACGVAGLVVAFIQFRANPGRTGASASIEFSFNGAAEGIAPDGNRFDLSGFTREEVLSNALQSAGLADRYTTGQIRANLVVTGVYPKDIVEQMTRYVSLLDENSTGEVTAVDYHATLYSVTLYNDFDESISPDQLTGLLENIMSEFRAFFKETYSVVLAADSTAEELSLYDYSQQLALLQQSIDQKKRFAEEMADAHPSFLLDRKGFNDLVVRYDALLTGDLDRLSGIVTINALSRDPERLIAHYENQISLLQIQIKEKETEAASVEDLLQKYNKDDIIYVSTTEELQKVDSNSSTTYDALVTRQTEITEEIAELKKSLTETQMKLSDARETVTKQAMTPAGEEPESFVASELSSEKNTEQQYQTVEKGITALITKRDAVTTDFSAFLKAYSEEQINETTVAVTQAKRFAPKILSGTFLKRVLRTAGPLCAVGLMGCLVVLIVSRRREEKKAIA